MEGLPAHRRSGPEAGSGRILAAALVVLTLGVSPAWSQQAATDADVVKDEVNPDSPAAVAAEALASEPTAEGPEEEAPAVPAEEPSTAGGEDESDGPGPSGGWATEPAGPRVSGSVTTRALTREGPGNDRASARVSLEWLAGEWSGAFTAQLDSDSLDGAVARRDGVGSFDLPERWIAWHRDHARGSVDVRAGTSYGLRFGEGLALGAASFDGLQLTVETARRLRVIALAGVTEALSPEDFFFEPPTLFPEDDENLGRDGRLAGVRLDFRPTDALGVGANLVHASADGVPEADLGSIDFAWQRERFGLSGELAARDGGGHALFLRGDVELTPGYVLGVERRDYRDFGSPLGNAPLYGGLSAGDERDENGWLVRLDFAPTRRFSGRWSFDYSQGPVKGPGLPSIRRDHRLELDFVVGERTALAYGYEFEDTAGNGDGQVHSILVTHAFVRGGRISSRLLLDRATPGWRSSLRTSYRVPLLRRRLTLLVDDTVRREGASWSHVLTAGCSVRTGAASLITVRATADSDGPASAEVTWYRRF